jgi:hypothetical protein
MPAAPITLTELKQQFNFGGNAWLEVERYDKCAAHVAISKSIQRIQAVDFLGLTRGNGSPSLVFIEVKDYRSGKTGVLPPHKDVAKELAEKVLGTLAGIPVAARADQAGFNWRLAGRHLVGTDRRISVVLHIESSAWLSPVDAKVELGTLALALEKELAWLQECRVIACSELSPGLQDCAVSTSP